MRRLLAIHIFMVFSLGCQLLDNSVRGTYGSEVEPIASDIKFDLAGCSKLPPEALPYHCQLNSEITYTQNSSLSDLGKIAALNLTPTFAFTDNTCTGLSITSEGVLSGEILKLVTESCTATISATLGDISKIKILNLTVDPSLTFSFDKENIFLQEGQAETTAVLNLSKPAPYDTYVEFEVYGDTAQVVSGISFLTKRIVILKGQSSVSLDLSVSSSSGISQAVHQQLRLKSGSSNLLPGLSINSFEATATPHNFSQIAAGTYHTCGIEGGNLFCWGYNDRSQVGNDSFFDVEAPLQIGVASGWEKIAAGSDHTCGIENGNLFCWGYDGYGKIGDGNNISETFKTPTQIGSLANWQLIAASKVSSCGIESGQLYCWGGDSYGQLGNGSGSSANVIAPELIDAATTWVDISMGGYSFYYHTCGIKSGELFCWGSNFHGQIGNGTAGATEVESPVKIGVLTNWQSVSVGNRHTCGIDSGQLYCWGSGGSGQLGNGLFANTSSPIQVGNSSLWQSVTSGSDHEVFSKVVDELHASGLLI